MVKKIVIAMLLSSSLMMTQATPAPQSQTSAPATQSAKDPGAKARTLLDNMLKALGGQAYLSYETMEQQGRTYSFYQGQPNSTGALFWRFWRYPDKERIELTKDRDVVYIHNGDRGYEVTFKGTAPEEDKLLEEFIRRRQHSMEIVTREWLKDPATIVLYVGTAVADQKFVEQISIINAKNDEVTISIDPLTNLPIRKSFTWRDEERYKNEETEVYANYRQVQGIMTPFTVSRLKDGLMASQRFLSSVQFNTPIEIAKFEAKTTYDPFPSRKGKKQ